MSIISLILDKIGDVKMYTLVLTRWIIRIIFYIIIVCAIECINDIIYIDNRGSKQLPIKKTNKSIQRNYRLLH